MIRPVNDLLELVYPTFCASCLLSVSETEAPICLHCRSELPIWVSKPFKSHEPLFKKFEGLIPLKYAVAFLQFSKGGSTQRLLHSLKYEKRPEVGILLGKLLANSLLEAEMNQIFDLILPIPLHPAKLKVRGYNQAMAFAEGLAVGLQSQASDSVLIRTTATETQTRKGKLQRILNVNEVFQIVDSKKNELAGKHILLVDDVVTTGSTMEACARLVIQEPIASISVATIAMD
jgi:ComF family protein